ncbi:MAG: RnfABCDGE type electron transport complex subunit G [Desulfobacteraceae bacterium]|nr:RnfABCDGE type electron transport complex subunit G [Desulfobacteraceae bacterium]
MREMIQMVVVLVVLGSVSGGLLAAVRNGTQDKIENQQLKFVKGPAIASIMEGASNDPITDRFKITVGDEEKSVFVGKFDGKPNAIALETYGKGYGGDVGLMVGIDMDTDKLLGVGVTTHSETPGMGAKAKSDPSFVSQFRGLAVQDAYKVGADGGQINAMSGATITSRAVCSATTDAVKIFKEKKSEIEAKMQEFK